jgi:cell division septation protein DedD
MGFWDRVLGREEQPEPTAQDEVATAPTAVDINAALDNVDRLVADAAVPSVVRARALAVAATVRKTLPRLDLLGLGSYDSYSVVATATDYLPEAIGAYLRLPRDWADSRPVDGGKTSLLLLVDQLDLLSVTMDAIYDAANTTDAAALVTQGRFLTERFGHAHAPELNLGTPTPATAQPEFEPLPSRPAEAAAPTSSTSHQPPPDPATSTDTPVDQPRGPAEVPPAESGARA